VTVVDRPASGDQFSGPALGARRGEQVLRRLVEEPPTLWYRGEQVRDITRHPALRNGARSLARLYDLQWERADDMLYESPSTGHGSSRVRALDPPE
jgi:aromatic ring hydroxylase